MTYHVSAAEIKAAIELQNSQRVRIDSLRKGDRFKCCSNRKWTYDRHDHALSGASWAICDDGQRDCFCDSALVFPL